jgi:hypothetical protein
MHGSSLFLVGVVYCPESVSRGDKTAFTIPSNICLPIAW